MIIADNGVIIRMKASEISKISRNTKGVRIMRMRGEGSVVCVSVAPAEPDEEELEKVAAEHAEEYAQKDAQDRQNEVVSNEYGESEVEETSTENENDVDETDENSEE
jgi:DNA gyrase subunit A